MRPFDPEFLPFVMLIFAIIYMFVSYCKPKTKKAHEETKEALVNYFEALSQ
jgi:hypothetical protein